MDEKEMMNRLTENLEEALARTENAEPLADELESTSVLGHIEDASTSLQKALRRL